MCTSELLEIPCSDYLEEEVGNSPVERPIYLLGESMGAIASLAVASERPDLVDRVVIVNPATSYPRSIAARLGPLLPRLSGVSPSLCPAYPCLCYVAAVYLSFTKRWTPAVKKFMLMIESMILAVK